MSQKRVVAIHDISCFGKCSLTVALPILSACGCECAVIPTAVLSTHTGGFKGYTFRDLTDDILPVARHWKQEGLTADAFYTGYLGSIKQTELVAQAIDLVKNEQSLVITDPAMADGGKLYAGFSPDFPKAMLGLCQKADIIVPNITEACLMTGLTFRQPPFDESYVRELVTALYRMTGAAVVLTGVALQDGLLGAAVYDGRQLTYTFKDQLPGFFHGTGDIFASALVGAYLKGHGLTESASIAADLVCDSIAASRRENPDRTYGVNFESALPALMKRL